MASFDMWLCHWSGVRLLQLPIGPSTRFDYVKAVNHSGAFTLELPFYLSPDKYIKLDYLLQFFRSSSTPSPKQLDFLGFIRYWRFERKEDGTIWTILKGHDPSGLLDRRIVAYDSDDTKAQGYRDPDNIMIDVFKENFSSSATNVVRDFGKINGLPLPHSADIGVGPYKGVNLTNWNGKFAWRAVPDLFRVLQETSYTNDSNVDKLNTIFYGIEVTSINNDTYKRPVYRFKVNLGQYGNDLTWTSDKPKSILFNNANGNLINEFYEEDHRNEKNVIYAGSVGQGSTKQVVEVSEPARSEVSGWARAEAYIDARSEIETDSITDIGYAALAEFRPRIIAGGDLIDSPYARYGRDWYHGDKVTIEVFGTKYDGVIMSTSYRLEEGEETITSRVLHEST